MSGFTKGPWQIDANNVHAGTVATVHHCTDGWADIWSDKWMEEGMGPEVMDANARLIASAPELYEALKQTIALAWQDTREVKFDSTVLFGLGYDFDGWELFRSEIHTPAGSWAVWSSNGKYSAYGGPDGGMWFEKFDTSEAAEEAVLREIDRLCPSFPTAVARAALSKAAGEDR